MPPTLEYSAVLCVLTNVFVYIPLIFDCYSVTHYLLASHFNTTAGSNVAITIVMLGKFFIAGSFAIAYNYTAEMFPTVVRNTALGVGSMCARLSGAMTPLISLLDSFDKTIPPAIFGSIAVLSGLLSLLLPETLNKPMPQTIDDGEKFGVGDTAFRACCGGGKEDRDVKSEVPLKQID